MKWLFGFLLLSTSLFAQNDYFQQEVNYKIDVQLNDEEHLLQGTIKIEYVNNSPDELTEIYMHLWPNAYSTKETAFAKQALKNRSTKFYYAKQKDLGGLSKLDFLVNGNGVKWNLDEQHPDIAILRLEEPLPSGGRITISTPFTLDIPASFSRLGHVGQSYQMTQWYPKPAVYDRKGWHPMPYLDKGEFFSEFGNFEVSITLPKNYVVGATGVLQTQSEVEFLDKQISKTKAYLNGQNSLFPENNAFSKSSKNNKTLRYTAEKVHDFAWFADKRFRVLKDEVTLESGKKVDTWVMFTEKEEELWKDAVEYVNRSVLFYSDKVGEYPYPHATAVQSALSAGAGMEYPMITVIGLASTAKALDEVITHEVGHNWFYGILASDERVHPWMDEGLNSYYQYRYMRQNYDSETASVDMIPAFLMGKSDMRFLEASYLINARRNLDQAADTHSNESTLINYGVGSYTKPAMVLDHLEAYLGTEEIDIVMQNYYQEWKFKHPYPEDFKASLEASTGKDLSWVFDDLLFSSKKLDYALKGVTKSGDDLQLTIKNKGEINAPFPVSAVKDGEVVATQWYEGIEDEETINFQAVDYDDLVIDVERITLEIDRTDNRKRANSLNVNFLAQIENDKKRSFSIFPVLSYNAYDQFMLGIGVHNKSLPFRNLEFAATPMYGFSSGRLTGVGGLRYNLYPKGKSIERISLQLNGRTFSYAHNEDFDFHNYFTKIAPKIELTFGRKAPTSDWQQHLSYRYIDINQNFGRRNPDTEEISRNERSYGVNELQYRLENSNVLSPSNLNVTLENNDAFTKVFARYQQRFPYQEKKKGLTLRLFAGQFLQYDPTRSAELGVRPAFLLTGNTTGTFQQDYLYDAVLFGRSEASITERSLFQHQIFEKDAGFKTLTSVGASTSGLYSAGFRSTLPGALPLDIFADGAYSGLGNAKGQFFYSAGLVLPIIRNVFEIYIPVLESNEIKANHNATGRQGLLERLTFRIDFSKLNLLEVEELIDFN
ncbi:MAG: M1 family metallopeptidase [Bacteroidota bacterium]